MNNLEIFSSCSSVFCFPSSIINCKKIVPDCIRVPLYTVGSDTRCLKNVRVVVLTGKGQGDP